MSIRAILVDDEDLARQILREYLSQEEDVEIVAECANGFDAVKAIAEWKPDLAFLDVQMPKLDGFEVLELVDTELAVVFVTAYDQYAMKAFEAAAVDYLLKPFDESRLRTALEKARRRLAQTSPRHPERRELKQAAAPPVQWPERIVVKDGTRVHIIPVGQLEYAEAQDDYVALHTRRQNSSETADDRESGRVTGSRKIRPCASLISHQPRARFQNRALHKGQPAGNPRERRPSASQPGWLSQIERHHGARISDGVGSGA